MFTRTLVDTGQDVVPLQVLNPTDQLHTLYKNTITATCEPAEVITMAREGRACVPRCQSMEDQLPIMNNLTSYQTILYTSLYGAARTWTLVNNQA